MPACKRVRRGALFYSKFCREREYYRRRFFLNNKKRGEKISPRIERGMAAFRSFLCGGVEFLLVSPLGFRFFDRDFCFFINAIGSFWIPGFGIERAIAGNHKTAIGCGNDKGAVADCFSSSGNHVYHTPTIWSANIAQFVAVFHCSAREAGTRISQSGRRVRTDPRAF